MARRAVKEPLLVRIRGVMLGAHGVVGAEEAEFLGALEVTLDVPPHVHKAAERALGP